MEIASLRSAADRRNFDASAVHFPIFAAIKILATEEERLLNYKGLPSYAGHSAHF